MDNKGEIMLLWSIITLIWAVLALLSLAYMWIRIGTTQEGRFWLMLDILVTFVMLLFFPNFIAWLIFIIRSYFV